LLDVPIESSLSLNLTSLPGRNVGVSAERLPPLVRREILAREAEKRGSYRVQDLRSRVIRMTRSRGTVQQGDSYSEEEPESRHVEPNRRSERALESERRM